MHQRLITKISLLFVCAQLTASLLSSTTAVQAQPSRDAQLAQIKMSLPLLDARVKSAPSAEAYFMRGYANYALLKSEAAEADFEAAEKLHYSAKLFDFYELRGSNFLVLKKYDAAIQQLTKAIDLKPDQAPCLTNRASAYFEAGRYKESLVDALRSVKLDDQSSAAQQLVGTSYLKMGNLDQALEYINRAISLEPKNFEAVHYRSLVYDKLGKKELAEKDQAAAAALGWAPGKSFEEMHD